MKNQQAVVENDAQPPAVPVASDLQNFTSMVERLASNPAVDVEKLERLLALQERVLARNAVSAYDAAMADMQPKLPVVGENGKITVNGVVRGTYALFEDINEAIKPILADHGFSITFRTKVEPQMVNVTGVLAHRGGHREETTISLPVDTSGSKNAVQAVGSSVSYGQRYVTNALLNLTSKGLDDDGRKAETKKADPASTYDVEAALRKIETAATIDALENVGASIPSNLPKAQHNRLGKAYADKAKLLRSQP